MKRILSAIAFAGILSFLMPAAASADTLYLVTIDCGDGYPLQATVDLPTLTDLQASVQAIATSGSGMSCSLSSSVVPSVIGGVAASADSGTTDLAVGGGTYPYNNGACEASFGISAHRDADGTVHGSQAFTTRPDGCSGHIEANVTCLTVDHPAGPNVDIPATAEMIGDITAASGAYAAEAGQSPPNTFLSDVTDNGQSSTGTKDMINQFPDFPTQEQSCAVPPPGGTIPLDSGNITVRGPITSSPV
jgi:hypothetical protein